MTIPQGQSPQTSPDPTRRYLAVGIVVILLLIAILSLLVLRIWRPKPAPVVRLIPAAAALESLEQITLDSSGWPAGLLVNPALLEPEGSLADAKNWTASAPSLPMTAASSSSSPFPMTPAGKRCPWFKSFCTTKTGLCAARPFFSS